MTGNALSHDSFTRLLASGHFNERYVWKKSQHEIHKGAGTVIHIRTEVEQKSGFEPGGQAERTLYEYQFNEAGGAWSGGIF